MDETLDDLFSIFGGLDGVYDSPPFTPLEGTSTLSSKQAVRSELEHDKSRSSSFLQYNSETELEPSPKSKRPKLMAPVSSDQYGQQRVTHIAVERNRRKQMNEHFSVLRSLMPCFYAKRGDQASIIGGVVDYISELQEILQTLEAKKQRRVVHNEVLSPRKVSSSPRPSPMSPRLNNLPISPRTPQPRLHQLKYNANMPSLELSPSSSSSNTSSSKAVDTIDNELVANSRSLMADVKVKFSGPNLLLKTVSPRIPGQALKIVAALEELALETLHLNISTVEDTMLVNFFTIKIGIECQLSAEELAQEIQQTFC